MEIARGLLGVFLGMFFERVAWGSCFLGSYMFGDVDFGTSLARGVAWGGFCWGSESGVY